LLEDKYNNISNDIKNIYNLLDEINKKITEISKRLNEEYINEKIDNYRYKLLLEKLKELDGI